MNTKILVAIAWLVSLVAAYFIGTSGSAKQTTDAGGTGGTPSANTQAGAAANEPGSVSKPGRARAFGDPDELGAPGAKANVAAIIARARAEMGSGMGGMMNIRGMLRAIAPLVDLDPTQIQEALTEVEKTIREPQQKMMFYSVLLGQWAEMDGKAALEYADTKLGGNPMFDMGVRAQVLGAWARTNPDEAWRWYENERKNISSDRRAQMMTSMVFAGMAASGNLDTALSRLSTLNEEERGMAMQGISQGSMSPGARRTLLDRSAGMPENQRNDIRRNILNSWLMTDTDEAAKWLRALPAAEQQPLRESAAQSLIWMNPQKGAELMLENAEPKELPKLYDRVIGSWAHNDLRAAGDWLTKQPQGPELDNARMTYATIASQKDPTGAMDWARSVTEPDKRAMSVGQVYSNWKMRDEKAADAALNSSGLSAEQIQKVRDNARPKPAPAEAAEKFIR